MRSMQQPAAVHQQKGPTTSKGDERKIRKRGHADVTHTLFERVLFLQKRYVENNKVFFLYTARDRSTKGEEGE